jgi:type I restriction enzyme M protein
MTSNAIVQKLWNYCNILRDDGLSYQDYIEQLTFLLFLKMADERQKLFPKRATLIPRDLDWQSLERLDGEPLDTHYRHILVELGKNQPPQLGSGCQGCTRATPAHKFTHHDGPLHARSFRRQAECESEAG